MLPISGATILSMIQIDLCKTRITSNSSIVEQNCNKIIEQKNKSTFLPFSTLRKSKRLTQHHVLVMEEVWIVFKFLF